MRPVCFVCQLTILINAIALAQSIPVPLIDKSALVVRSISTSHIRPKAESRILDSYGKLPLSFEANHGQADAQVKFLSRMGGYSLFLTGDEAVLAFSGKKADTKANRLRPSGAVLREAAKGGGVLTMKLRNANAAAKITGVDELPSTINYFIGSDPGKWHSSVPTYAKVKYEGIYSGIDLVYYGNQRQLEYDFIVAPGADPHRLAFDLRGTKGIRRDALGNLVLTTDGGEIRWHKPVAYQKRNGTRQEIAARYATKDNRVTFEVANYDASEPLYIDPLIYSTFLGGSGNDEGYAIAVDSAGNAYVTGSTTSADFPTGNPLQPSNGGGSEDAFVAKINPSGSALVYSTYLGGSEGDTGYGIAVDGSGYAYVTGVTCSTNFPTMNPLQPSNGGICNAFLAKVSPSGSALVYSTYLGGTGNSWATGVAVDGAGNAYLTGVADSNFPTMNPLQPTYGGKGDAFVAKINPSGSALVYSTYLGGRTEDMGSGIAVDSSGNAYVTGWTISIDFPVTPGAFQTACKGGSGCYNYSDAFVAKINSTGSALVYSTYLGGSYVDAGSGIAVDSSGDAYVVGWTSSTDFPTMNPLQADNGGANAFVAKINATGSALVYSTYLGGSGGNGDYGMGIAVDSVGNAYVAGGAHSNNFPTETPLQECHNSRGDGDGFVSKINPTGSVLVYSTCLGGSLLDGATGIAADSAGNVYVTGITYSPKFPTKNPFQPTYGGAGDAFVTKIDMRAVPTITLSSSLNPSIYGQALTLAASVSSVIGMPPDGETVTFMNSKKVLGTGSLSGGSAIFTTSTLNVGTIAVTAVYTGDATFGGGMSRVVKQVVSKATTTASLASSQNPSNSGQSVTFTASVAPQFSGKVTGTVTFFDGATLLKTVAVSGDAAKFKTSTLASGMHTITATYNGSTSFDGCSSTPLTQTVN